MYIESGSWVVQWFLQGGYLNHLERRFIRISLYTQEREGNFNWLSTHLIFLNFIQPLSFRNGIEVFIQTFYLLQGNAKKNLQTSTDHEYVGYTYRVRSGGWWAVQCFFLYEKKMLTWYTFRSIAPTLSPKLPCTLPAADNVTNSMSKEKKLLYISFLLTASSIFINIVLHKSASISKKYE